MKNSLRLRAFAFFLAAQFLNVQIQSAFATEAVISSQSEIGHALSKVKQKLATRLSKLGETAQLKLAYKFYKSGVRLRNKTFRKSDADIQARLQRALVDGGFSDEKPTHEDQEIATELNESGVLADLEEVTTIRVAPQASKTNKEELLRNADPILLDLGSSVAADGQLTRANFETFKQKVHEIGASDELARAPAAMGKIIKIILATLLIVAGLSALYAVFAIVVITAVFAPQSFALLGAVCLILATVGIVYGVIWGVRAILNARNLNPKEWQRGALPLLVRNETPVLRLRGCHC